MENIVVRRLVAPFAAALVLLIHLAPASAAGQSAQVDQDQPVEVTYTKWVVVQDGIPFLTGFTGGDVVGAFSGQVFVGVTSADGRIRRLEAQYSVDGADRSFSALIRGGGNPATGAAILDGTSSPAGGPERPCTSSSRRYRLRRRPSQPATAFPPV
jgi:hypothetical protein